MHKRNECGVDPKLTQFAVETDRRSEKHDDCLRTIDQLAHGIVSTWVADNSIEVRPSEKAALKSLIAEQVLQYIAADTKRAIDPSPEYHFERGRLACIELISEINEEPFVGFICKQRALNACVQMPES